jgi:hypothetical protein
MAPASDPDEKRANRGVSMPTPSFEQMKQWAENYVKFWNSGDKEAWIENWRAIAPGDFRMLDPVGTPEKRGFEECCLDSYDLFQPNVKFNIPEGKLFICGNEVAWLLENKISTKEREDFLGYSLETYRFEADGSVVIRTYYKVPARSEDELGDMFKEYLPEGEQSS